MGLLEMYLLNYTSLAYLTAFVLIKLYFMMFQHGKKYRGSRQDTSTAEPNMSAMMRFGIVSVLRQLSHTRKSCHIVGLS